jgi:hypothetical protein
MPSVIDIRSEDLRPNLHNRDFLPFDPSPAECEYPVCPHSGDLHRKNAAVRAIVCFGERSQAAFGEVDRQVWADCSGAT